jgi:hypothetical protein
MMGATMSPHQGTPPGDLLHDVLKVGIEDLCRFVLAQAVHVTGADVNALTS